MDLKTSWERVLAPTYATPTLLIDRGEGCYLFDAQGKRYLDFIAGIAVCSTGHAHPRVVEAIQKQAARLLHVSNLYATTNVIRFAERLTAISGYDRAFFCNSGAEANEMALKVARRHAHAKGKPEAVVIALDQSFHGRTTATVTLTGQPKYQKNFDPLVAQVVHVPANDPVALEMAFARSPVAAVFLEFIQGEGGVRVLKPEFVQAVQKLCLANDALLVADEVQTGVGRTGRFLASQHYGVRPDITTLAKGIASGVPLGAVLLNTRAASLLAPGDHGSTFGGNPLATAAGLATLDVIQGDKLVENADAQGLYLRTQVKARVPGVKDARGLGLLVGIELEKPIAKAVKADLEAAGLLVNAIGDHVLRLAPPLIVTSQQVDDAVATMEKVVARRLAAA